MPAIDTSQSQPLVTRDLEATPEEQSPDKPNKVVWFGAGLLTGAVGALFLRWLYKKYKIWRITSGDYEVTKEMLDDDLLAEIASHSMLGKIGYKRDVEWKVDFEE
jgi:hypothetical protein